MAIETFSPNSSMIATVQWDSDSGDLTVEMVNGGEYTTPSVTQQQYESFKNAPSAGRWYNQNIRGRL